MRCRCSCRARRSPSSTCPIALASTETVYAGEPVAVVVADTRYLAEDAAALVEVDYEPLPGVSDCVAAMEPGEPAGACGSEVERRRPRADHGG